MTGSARAYDIHIMFGFLRRKPKREPPPRTGPEFHCSFCNKSQRDVKKLIAGPNVYICDECVEICNDILAHPKKDG